MESVGIIAEYNPFHNGHLYHLEMVRKMFPDDVIIVVLSGHFMQRGEVSVINKWDKSDLALSYGADIVVELPFPFATQSADIFARGAIEILKSLGVSKLVFGSESNDIEKLMELAKIQLNNDEYQNLIKKYLDEGVNYPTALSKSLSDITNTTVNTPNDILGISYIREIIRQDAEIKAITIKRTNDYHSLDINDTIASASSIRKGLRENINVEGSVPAKTYEYLGKNLFFIEDYYSYLKYQIMVNIDHLDKFQTVDEGIENRIKKNIIESHNLNDLISKIKTKRYTFNKIRRMLTHIMCNFTKEEAAFFKNVTYLRILGFNNKGQKYLNQIKKNISLPIISKFSKINDPMLELEMRATSVYASILNEEEKTKLIQAEYKNNSIRKTVN